jgi:ATPase, P-type (transporting), HAD superfamily, subfamily IC/heavy metal translocating P-type ATPase
LKHDGGDKRLSTHGGAHNDRHAGEEDTGDHHHVAGWVDFARITLVAVGAVLVWFRVWEPFPQVSVVGLTATLVGGWPIFREAVENLVARRMTMELSMTIALIAALVIGEVFTALVITLFVLVAEVLEGMTVDRGRRAIEDLLHFLPTMAVIRRGDAAVEVTLDEMAVGDTVLVKPGVKLPVDGTVILGHSYVDQATITGEPMPVEKVAGSQVFAGTLNQAGALEVRAERLGRDTSFGKIVEAVERAERSRAPVQRLADRLAGYLVYFALGAALLTYLITRDSRATISVVIVAGACGIAAGTPLAILGAIGRAARQGAIVKGGRYLETLALIDTVALDKTGTLTFGTPRVTAVHSVDGVSSEELIEVAAVAERRSEHPLGKAILVRAAESGLQSTEPDRFEAAPGRGVAAWLRGEEILVGNRAFLAERGVVTTGLSAGPATIGSEVVVARAGALLGAVYVADELRLEAKAAILALREMGIRSVLLTGDQRGTAEAVAGELGVDDVRAELLPDAKVAEIERLGSAGRRVAMVGDGLNDAAALAAASASGTGVGVAMGSGTDIARESADVVLIGNDLSRFVDTVRLSRRMRGIILQNFVGTIVVDAVGMGLAALGFLNPLLAAFIHVSSELAFILNSTRLLPRVR